MGSYTLHQKNHKGEWNTVRMDRGELQQKIEQIFQPPHGQVHLRMVDDVAALIEHSDDRRLIKNTPELLSAMMGNSSAVANMQFVIDETRSIGGKVIRPGNTGPAEASEQAAGPKLYRAPAGGGFGERT